MSHAHERTASIGITIADHVALIVGEAFTHLAREISICDGYGSRGESAGRTASPNSSTESAAVAAEVLRGQAGELHAAVDSLDAAAKRLARLASAMLGTRLPPAVDVKRCRDNQVGRDGAIEWGDPTCEELPTKAGLHAACYLREWRWRKSHGLEPRDIEPSGELLQPTEAVDRRDAPCGQRRTSGPLPRRV